MKAFAIGLALALMTLVGVAWANCEAWTTYGPLAYAPTWTACVWPNYKATYGGILTITTDNTNNCSQIPCGDRGTAYLYRVIGTNEANWILKDSKAFGWTGRLNCDSGNQYDSSTTTAACVCAVGYEYVTKFVAGEGLCNVAGYNEHTVYSDHKVCPN
jgi:hypothetical protein